MEHHISLNSHSLLHTPADQVKRSGHAVEISKRRAHKQPWLKTASKKWQKHDGPQTSCL